MGFVSLRLCVIAWRDTTDTDIFNTALPTSSMLKLGYHAACLILSLRCLEENGGAMRPHTFLSDEDADIGSNDGKTWSDSSYERGGKEKIIRAHACKQARLMLETFLEIPPSLTDSVSTCLCLCIGYCSLLLAHYGETQSGIPDQISLDVVTRVSDWVRHAPGKAWSFKYGDLARRKVEARTGKARQTGVGELTRKDDTHQVSRNCVSIQERPPRPHVIIGDNGSEPHAEAGDVNVYHATEWVPPGQSFDSGADAPGFEQSPFPSLESYFGGGFYEFTR